MTNEEIVALYNAGYTRKKMRRDFGLPLTKINKAIRHIPGAVPVPEKSFCEELILDYQNGFKINDLIKKFRIDTRTIDNIFYFYKVENIRRRNVAVDQHFFKRIDTEEKAYWLGFLFADGYNNEQTGNIELTLQSLDVGHIELFKKTIKSEHTIAEKTISGKYTCSRISFCSRIMSNDLASHGCVKAKSLILEFPSSIPNELTHHFVRGYFDGDGSVSVSKDNKRHNFHILGTESFLESIREKIGLSNTKLDKKGNCYDLRYGGRLNLLKIKEYLYKDATIFLERKKEKFDMC